MSYFNPIRLEIMRFIVHVGPGYPNGPKYTSPW